MKKDDKKLIHKALDGEANQSETKKLQQKLETDGRMLRVRAAQAGREGHHPDPHRRSPGLHQEGPGRDQADEKTQDLEGFSFI
jgi:hypothetical protein